MWETTWPNNHTSAHTSLSTEIRSTAIQSLTQSLLYCSHSFGYGSWTNTVFFCRKNHDECGAEHGREGSVKFAVEALVFAKSATSAFGPPLLETEALESDLMENILSSRVSFAEWNLNC